MTHKVGFFHNGSRDSFQKHFKVFERALRELVSDVEIQPVFADGLGDERSWGKNAKDAADGVAVLVVAGGPPCAKAAKDAGLNTLVPIVFTSVADPMALGLVESLEKPGKTNMTGVAGLTSELDVSRLELLRELLAGGDEAVIGVLNNANRPNLEEQYETLADAAEGLDLDLVRRDVVDKAEIKAAFNFFKKKKRVDAVLVTADSLFNNLRKDVVGFAAGVPAIYQWREFPEEGGLMSFGPNIFDAYAKVGEYAGRILLGELTSDLPVALPNRFEFVLNFRTAFTEGFDIPASILSRAQIVP